MDEKLVQEYIGKELIDFLVFESEEKIDNREIWICVSNIYNTVFHNHSFMSLLSLGLQIKSSLIKDIRYDDNDLTIYIENPFKGVD